MDHIAYSLHYMSMLNILHSSHVPECNAHVSKHFDGYYVLMDTIEIPNLYARSTQYLQYWVERHFLGLANARNPATAAGEAAWFTVYGIACVHAYGVNKLCHLYS